MNHHNAHNESIQLAIRPEMLVGSLLRLHPQLARMFIRRRLLCVGCPLAGFHTLADIAQIYQMELTGLLREIDAALADAPRTGQQPERA